MGAGLGLWALGLGLFAANQRRLIFKPPRHVRALTLGPQGGTYGIEELSLPVGAGAVLQGWRSAPLIGAPAGTLLYFGGRGENVAWAPHMSSYLAGWSVLSFNYRGFGGSTGQASEAAVMQDAQQVLAQHRPDDRPLVLMGRSLGTAVALRLAGQAAPRGLVLISPFLSLPHLARTHVLTAPAAPLLRHRMDLLTHAPAVQCPTLVVMAHRDHRVPNNHSQRLARCLGGPVTLAMIEGEQHRSLPRCVATQQRVAGFVLGAPGAAA